MVYPPETPIVTMKKQTASSLSEISNFCSNSHARVLVLSLRNINLHVSRAYHYEFEDVIETIDTVDILAPVNSHMVSKNDLPRRILRRLKASTSFYITNG